MNAHPGLFDAAQPAVPPSELRDYQADALAAVRREVAAGRRRIVLQLPTAAGKTRIAAAICEGALRKGNRAIFCVPLLSLVDQTVARFCEAGLPAFDVGVIQGSHALTDFTRPLQVASVQTLRRRKVEPPKIMIVDEGHVSDKSLDELLASAEWAEVIVIVLSATPWARGMGRKYECLLVPVTMKELIRDGWLVPPKIFAPNHPDLSGVKVRAGDYAEDQVAAIMGDGKLVADVVESWRRLGQGRPTLCFGVDRAHAKKLQMQFSAGGVRAEYIDAYVDPKQRDAAGARLRTGETQVVCNVGTLTTGVDWPWVSCLSIARPTKSEILHVQICGRGLRLFEGKSDCIVLDHASNTLNMGLPQDIHYESLDDGRKNGVCDRREQRTAKPKECSSCHFMRAPGVHRCPECGFAPERRSTIECEAGDLAEVRESRKVQATHAEKQRWYSGLLQIAEQRGYKRGWAANTYRERFKVWPRGLAEIAMEPSSDIRGYVTSRMIARAKRRAD